MAVPATTGKLCTRISEMEIGDYIVGCYEKNVGWFIGKNVGTEISLAGMSNTNTVSGFYYLIKVSKGLLIADRVVLNTISWDMLNTGKWIQGLPLDTGNIVPTMTSDTSPSGAASSNIASFVSGEPFRAFDKNINTQFHSLSGVKMGWLTYEFAEPERVMSYSLLGQSAQLGRAPRDWTFEGSDDGIDWTVLDVQSNQSFTSGVKKMYSCKHIGTYKFYRINVTANNGDTYLTISELEMFREYGTIRSLTGGVAYADANGGKSLTDKGFGAWPTNNEWDKYIVNFPSDKLQSGKTLDDVFHYNSKVYTWVQDTPTVEIVASTNRMIRGNAANPKSLAYTSSAFAKIDFGFRPVFSYKES